MSIFQAIFFLVFSVVSSANGRNFLSIEDRPDNVKALIDAAYDAVNDSNDFWSFNGDVKYKMAYVDEYKLLSGLIKSQPERKEFFFMDIGAGDFQLAKALSDRLNHDTEIRDDIFVHFFSLRGERYDEPEIVANVKSEIIRILVALKLRISKINWKRAG